MANKPLIFYEVSADGLAKVGAHFAAHKARLDEFHARGTLLMAGPYGSPPVGALGIFTTREAAEAFWRGDPFVINEVVSKVALHEWLEALAP